MLNAQHKTQTNWALIIMVAVFSALGGVVIYLSGKNGILPAAGFERYLVSVLIGSGILIGLYFFDYRKLKGPLYLVAVLASVASVFWGFEENGKCFFAYGSFAVSSEYITILYLISLSGIAEKNYVKGWGVIMKCVTFAGLSVGLTLLSVGFEQAAILTGAYLILYAVRYMTGRKLNKVVILAISLVLIGLCVAVIHVDVSGRCSTGT